ncbi:calcium-binding and coiled-coil domain-containing protein 2 [Xenopus laevis]|uniref:C2H2-type domain-containing protein n=2 Tax=Xenopus laevis TaxID=8355 RepID=A0A974BWR8_XENLA|nr:calcium-binding and coiled-coil domain-containing protein 2 [Xenopus laevis]OCT62151.1 hypothetical protein XELAEV_18043235mg [Xenopus laevis]
MADPKSCDVPPTSLLQPEERNYSQVIFSRMEKSFEPGTDIVCYFTFTAEFQPARKDWVGIFKVSWKTTREYYTWISAECDEQGLEKHVTFKAYYLPKDNDDYYQFCYVDHKGEVRGVSIPFQFCPKVQEEDEENILLVTTEEEAQRMKEKLSELEETSIQLQEKLEAAEKKNCVLQQEGTRVASQQKNLIESLQAQHLGWSNKTDGLKQQNQEARRQLEEERCRNRSLQLKLASEEEEQVRLKDETRSLQLEQNQIKEENMNLHQRIKDMESALKESSEEAKNHAEEVQVLKGELRDAKEGHQLLQEQLQDTQLEKKKDQDSIDLLTKEVTDLGQILERKEKALETAGKQFTRLQREQATLLQEMQDLNCTVELREDEISDMQKQRLRDGEEIEKLSRLLYQKSTSTPGGQGLYFPNPYEGESLVSLGNEPQSREAPGGSSGVRQEQMKCPECGWEFQDSQVYLDHVMCHGLDSME